MSSDFLNRANDILINVYPFWPIMVERGEGVYLYDTDGNKYLDFGAGIAVSQLGYGHPAYVEAIAGQAKKLHLGLCYIVDEQRLQAAEDILAASGFDQVFFGNSGTEAVEGALKTARKWSKETKSPDCTDVIYFRDSFHGRTMGALSVNGQAIYRDGFDPFLAGMHEAVFNDLDSVKALITDKISSIIVEPVQGEGGIHPATPEFLQGLRDLADEHNIALIFDEVQCGMGRTGSLFAFQHYGIVPDLICLAKGLGGGFPVGAYLGKRAFTRHITPGSHGSTYGGNPLACRVVRVMLEELQKPGFMENVQTTGALLKQGLEAIAEETGAFENVRGLGLMLAARYTGGKVKDLQKSLLKNGLIALTCGKNALRFVPPLIIGEKEVKESLDILKKTLKE